ncbi:MAG: hypothetical protein CL508_05255 [Actinobacteria bacterium]|nr:hypothetical protein [Actinomycetota bacterium]MBO71705.1 hypothetical protein [Actinomycetota bacterium]|tara:strand:+ start:28744 stop:29028 length:285 start_codon:yes stop_codon:yes gene_type:complete
MSNNKNISDLIQKAYDKKQGGVTAWYLQIPEEVKPFIEGIELLVKQGKKPNSTAVSRILKEEFNFSVSRAGINRWLQHLKDKETNEKNTTGQTS